MPLVAGESRRHNRCRILAGSAAMITPFVSRRRFVSSLATTALAASAPRIATSKAGGEARWRGYSRATIIDGCGSPGSANDTSGTLGAAELADVRASGVTAMNLTVGPVGSYTRDYDGAVSLIAHWDAEIAAHPDVLIKCNDVRDLVAAKRSGKLAIIYGFQDTTPFGEDPERLETFRGLGVRIVQLTYNRRNLAGDGCLEPGDAGLSQFGRDLVERMNAHDVLVDALPADRPQDEVHIEPGHEGQQPLHGVGAQQTFHPTGSWSKSWLRARRA